MAAPFFARNVALFEEVLSFPEASDTKLDVVRANEPESMSATREIVAHPRATPKRLRHEEVDVDCLVWFAWRRIWYALLQKTKNLLLLFCFLHVRSRTRTLRGGEGEHLQKADCGRSTVATDSASVTSTHMQPIFRGSDPEPSWSHNNRDSPGCPPTRNG